MQEVNSNLIILYFKLGKTVSENKQYGNIFTKQVSTELKLTFPNMKGFSERNIRSMRLFYEEYANDEKLNLTHITRLELENKVKCIYIDKYKNVKIDFK